MATEETHALGYGRVDDDPHSAVLLDAMDATSRWDATIRLRAWERRQLALSPGQRLLDVGCGLGDAALALAADLGTDGEAVGVDASTEMIATARARAATSACPTRFVVGDAMHLDEPDGSFDVVRSERTLQWLSDPARAVAEMTRVLRPGGLLSLIDTDWSTFTVDVGDDDLAGAVRDYVRVERNRPSHIGRRLAELATGAGLDLVDEAAVTQRWDAWDPDESPAPPGCFSMSSLAADLVDTGHLARGSEDRFVSTVHAAASTRRFAMSLTIHAVVARRIGTAA